MKKILRMLFIGGVLIPFVFSVISSSCFAQSDNLSLSPQVKRELDAGVVDFNDFIRPENSQREFENDTFSVNVSGIFEFRLLHKNGTLIERDGVREEFAPNTVAFIPRGRSQLLFVPWINADVWTMPGVILDIKNKTSKELYIDLTKSQVSIGYYSGRPKAVNEKNGKDLKSVTIPANGKKKIILWRPDCNIKMNYETKRPESNAPFELYFDKNIFGRGDFGLSIGKDKPEFVRFKCNAVFESMDLMKFFNP